jgi:hypothetical protein
MRKSPKEPPRPSFLYPDGTPRLPGYPEPEPEPAPKRRRRADTELPRKRNREFRPWWRTDDAEPF